MPKKRTAKIAKPAVIRGAQLRAGMKITSDIPALDGAKIVDVWPPDSLSPNDIALAIFACAHALNWVRKQGRAAYWRKERAKFEALNRKLSALSDRCNPWPPQSRESYYLDEGMSDDPVLMLNFRLLKQRHAAVAKILKREAKDGGR